jgi:hypothetical protein
LEVFMSKGHGRSRPRALFGTALLAFVASLPLTAGSAAASGYCIYASVGDDAGATACTP